MAPSSTPAPKRFLFPKRPGTQTQSQTPVQPSPGDPAGQHQFRATPRFSSTPRPTQTLGAHFTTPSTLGLALKPKVPAARSTQDLIDSLQPSPGDSSPTSPRVATSDAIEINSSYVSQSPLQDKQDERESWRSPKRRRISISPDVYASFEIDAENLASPDRSDDGFLQKSLKEASNVDVDSCWDSDEDHAGSEAEGEEQEDPDYAEADHPPRRSVAGAKFQDAPRFKAPEPSDSMQPSTLPEAFSPQRRGVKYVPDGLAAQLRDWIVKVKGNDEGGQGSDASVSLSITEARCMAGFSIVNTRLSDGADGEPGPPVILAGAGRLVGLGKPQEVHSGHTVTIYPPAWDVEFELDVGDPTRWSVACDWTVHD